MGFRYGPMAKVGETIDVKAHGKVIARIVLEENGAIAARKRLKTLRRKARVGDVTGPSRVRWNAERGRC
jgi:hypothetical protein